MDNTERRTIAGTLKMAQVTQTVVAEYLGVSGATLSAFFRDKRNLDDDRITALKDAAKLAADGRFLTALEAKRKELQQG